MPKIVVCELQGIILFGALTFACFDDHDIVTRVENDGRGVRSSGDAQVPGD